MREETIAGRGQTAAPGGLRAEAVEEWMLAQLSESLGVGREEIDIREPFASYGLGSVAAVGLTADLEDWLGISLPPTLAWDYTTIEELARHLVVEFEVQHGTSVGVRKEDGV